MLETLHQIKEVIIYKHNGLFLHLVNNLINEMEVFGLYFASLDIRQESHIHTQAIGAIAEVNLIYYLHITLYVPKKKSAALQIFLVLPMQHC